MAFDIVVSILCYNCNSLYFYIISITVELCNDESSCQIRTNTIAIRFAAH